MDERHRVLIADSYPDEAEQLKKELSGKYSQHTDFNELYGINDFNEKGYLVWYQFDGLFEEYTFFDYLATHYYNYLLALILLGMIYLGVGIIFAEKKQIPVSPDSKASSFDSIPENILLHPETLSWAATYETPPSSASQALLLFSRFPVLLSAAG